MNDHFETLTQAELAATVGGNWDWGDFFGGLSWSFGAGFAFTGNPILGVLGLGFAGLGMYF